MTKHILLTRPLHDIPTSYLHCISGELKKEIESVGEHKVIDLQKEDAVRKKFEKALDKINPRLVVLHGHGSYDSVIGQNEVILDKNNVCKLKSKIVYAVVCDAALDLGESAIKNGNAEAFIGYDSEFVIIVDPQKSAIPMKDKNFRPFKDVHKMLVLSLVSGCTVSTSLDRTKTHMRKLIREYGVRGIKDKYGDAPLIRFGLFWNLLCLKKHGNGDAVF